MINDNIFLISHSVVVDKYFIGITSRRDFTFLLELSFDCFNV